MPDDWKSTVELTKSVKESGCDVTHSGMMEIGASMVGVYAMSFIGYKLFKYVT